MSAPSIKGSCGAKHSPPRNKFQKSEQPHTTGKKHWKSRWCEALSSKGEVVRSTLLPGASFRNRGVLTQVGQYTPKSIFVWSSRIQVKNGAKHSPPGAKFQKSEGLHVAMAKTAFHQVSCDQITSKCRCLVRYHHYVDVDGAKHSPPGDKFQKSKGPPIAVPGPSEIKIPMVKLCPHDSILVLKIFDLDSICVN